MTDKLLEGELRTTSPLPVSYGIVERAHRFVRQSGRLYRSNEIWRETRLKSHGAPLLKTERLFSNFAEVRYAPGPGVVVHEVLVP